MAYGIYTGATEPIWYGDRKVYTVTGFTEGVRGLIADLASFWVEAEVSDFRHQQGWANIFCTLKDPENGFTVRCTMPRTRFEALGITVSDGDLVQVYGRADLYTARGEFQFRAQTMEHAGRGLLMRQLEELTAKLAAEGLFDEERKLPLPFMPRRVGLITGNEAAARDDFFRNIWERFPPAKLVVCETFVQGPKSAPLLVAALRKMDAMADVDVIVLARGGGAFEDFLPFSDERLLRAIAACQTPVVSAIGHEKDSPISDLVADLRVSTPTAAARAVVPDYAQLVRGVDQLRRASHRRCADHVTRRMQSLRALRHRLTRGSPSGVIDMRRHHVLRMRNQMTNAVQHHIRSRQAQLRHDRAALSRFDTRISLQRERMIRMLSHLRALSPQHTMERGFSIVRDSAGAVIPSAAELNAGVDVTLTFADGTRDATITGGNT